MRCPCFDGIKWRKLWIVLQMLLKPADKMLWSIVVFRAQAESVLPCRCSHERPAHTASQQALIFTNTQRNRISFIYKNIKKPTISLSKWSLIIL
jgi:hypothetical protein